MAALGVQELRPRFAAAFATYEITPAFECEERIVADDLAFDRGWDVQTLRARASGVESLHRQRVFLLLCQGRDARWRFARAITQPGPN